MTRRANPMTTGKWSSSVPGHCSSSEIMRRHTEAVSLADRPDLRSEQARFDADPRVQLGGYPAPHLGSAATVRDANGSSSEPPGAAMASISAPT